MRRIFILFFVMAGVYGFAQPQLQEAESVPDEFVIRLRANDVNQVNMRSAQRLANQIGLASIDDISQEVRALEVNYALRQDFSNPDVARDLDLNRYFVVKVPTGSDMEEVMAKYLALKEVELVEANYIARKHVSPNDPLYGEQWGLNNTGNAKEYNSSNLVGTPGSDINVEQAWDIHTGTSSVTIAIIDEGVDYTHPEFAGRMVAGYDFYSNDNDPFDEGGHGTACAGIAAAAGNNGIGVAGVTWGTLIMPIRALGPQGGSYTDIADAITWAVDNGADVISMSLGGGSTTSYLSSAVSYAYANDVLVFASRGNGNNTADNYPSSYSTVISVGGLSPCNTRKTPSSCDGEFWWGASYGGGEDKMDFVAPAARITTTDITGSGGYSANEYTDSFNGTSSACPYAAGDGALIRSYNPTLTVDEIRTIMRQTAADIGASGYDAETGYGKVDAYAALIAAGATACTLPAPANFSASNIGDNSFDLSWNAVSGASSYTVSVDGNESTVSSTSTSITGLTAGTAYTCTVAANCSEGGSGSSSEIVVTTTGTTPISCSGTVSSYTYSEGFESGDGWTQTGGDDGNWYRTSGSTPSSGTGPSSAAQGSFYLFLEASTNGSPGQIGNNATAILESPCFDLSGESSATFSFQNHMYGTAVGSLVVEATTNDASWASLWSQSGNQGNQWNSVDISLDAYVGGTVKLRIVGTTGNGWSSDIAIDDLAVSTGSGADTEAPTDPTGLTVSNIAETSLSLSWNASSDNVGVVQYNVFVDGSNIGSVTGTGANITGLTAATTYTLGVQAQDAAGNTSGTTTTTATTAGGGACSNVTVDSENFESGWGIWNDGGSDARRSANDAAYSNGTYSIRLRDNTSTSTMTTDILDLSSFEDLTVSFSYLARSMDNSNEDFWLQVSTNGGSSYTTVEEWNQGDEFVNNVRENDAVTIPGPFTATTRLRFRCDASGNSDWVYIDDVVIEGCSVGGASALVANSSINDPVEEMEEFDLSDITLYPNPVQDVLTISGLPREANVTLISLSGTLISSGVGVTSFNMSGLQSGLYILLVEVDGESNTYKIIKQ